jgi:hypothetical protein
VLDEAGIAGIIERRGELADLADAFVQLPQREQASVGPERGVRDLELDGQRREKVEREQRGSC